MKPSLSELTSEVIRLQKAAQYSPETIALFRRVFNRLELLAIKMNISDFTNELAAAFIADSSNKKTGEYCKSRFLLHNEAVFRLNELKNNGDIDWKHIMSIIPEKETPNTEIFRQLLETFIIHLETEGKHNNTISSYRNVAVKFLLFCEANDILQIEEIKPEIIPLFFQDLATTWSVTSMRTSASALRTFLAHR